MIRLSDLVNSTFLPETKYKLNVLERTTRKIVDSHNPPIPGNSFRVGTFRVGRIENELQWETLSGQQNKSSQGSLREGTIGN